MSYFKTCPDCGAHLDPGELCDCRENEKTNASSSTADGGRVETVVADYISTSSLSEKRR